MNLEMLANLGEFVGGVAVIATLAYLATQIRQATKVSRANISKDLFLASRSAILDLAANEHLTKAMAEIRGVEEDELRRDMVYQSFYRLYELVFSLHSQGFVEDDIRESYAEMVRVFANTRHFDEYWNRHQAEFNQQFRTYVEKHRGPPEQ